MCSSSRWYMKRFMHCDIFFLLFLLLLLHLTRLRSADFSSFFLLFEGSVIESGGHDQYFTSCSICTYLLHTLLFGMCTVHKYHLWWTNQNKWIQYFVVSTTYNVVCVIFLFIFGSYSSHCRSSFSFRLEEKKIYKLIYRLHEYRISVSNSLCFTNMTFKLGIELRCVSKFICSVFFSCSKSLNQVNERLDGKTHSESVTSILCINRYRCTKYCAYQRKIKWNE